MAGFWGLTNPVESIAANSSFTFPAKCGGTAWLAPTVQYVDGTNTAFQVAMNCAASLGGAVPGSGALVLRPAMVPPL
jgi:hypothetical protein